MLAINPNYADAYALLAGIDERKGDSAEALKNIQHALSIDPNRAAFHSALALLDSAKSGSARLIDMRDLETALSEVRPSVGSWLEIARNVAQFANQSGTYDDLQLYLKARKLA